MSSTFSVKTLKSELPSFSTHFAQSTQALLNQNEVIILLVGYILFILYLSGLYRNRINLSISNHISKTFSGIGISFLSLFVYFYGFYNLFSFANVWNTFLGLFITTLISINIPHILLILVLRILMHKGYWGLKTLLIGSNGVLKNTYSELLQLGNLSGNKITDVIKIDDILNKTNDTALSYYEAEKLINEHQPDEIIIAVPSTKEKMVTNLISVAKMKDISIKLVPDMESIVKGFARIESLVAPPFIAVSRKQMPVWQEFIKRIIDIVIALIGLLMLIPFFPFIAWGIKKSSKGPVFFNQERIGKNGKPFKIIKFRSMIIDAEVNGPALSSINDSRVTSFGRFLRRWRIDETPQFLNVLIGQMSIVGPRPERAYFINEISKKAPQYSEILQCRPGITSLGMVKYGYAENIEQMIQRLNYDILYIHNLSLWIDIKIIIYTLKTLISGEGK
ncbi:sugar transferase [Marinilabiliaceae bacterium A049]|nr:sugar transferase [Marinilabiliaceae bacterium A049]